MRWVVLAVLVTCSACSVLSEESTEPQLKIMARSSVYNVGEKKAIYCKAINLSDQPDWFSPSKEKVEGKATKNTRIYAERKSNEPNVLALIIVSTKVEDTGNWTCTAGELTQTLEIVVGVKVNIPLKYEKVTYDEGKSAKLNCPAEGDPLPVVQWYKEGLIIEEDPQKYMLKTKGNLYTLEIKHLNYSDAGEYICKVTQKSLSHYTDKTINLSLSHKPYLFDNSTKIIYPHLPPSMWRTEEVFAVMNHKKNITCFAIGNPLPKFQWFKRRNNFDEVIAEEDTITHSEDGTSSTMILRMRDENDKGQYKCTATNSKGQIGIIFDVTPGEAPLEPNEISLNANNATHLTFNVTCSNCTFQHEEETPMSASNLPVIGYNFQLVPQIEDIPVDWDLAQEFDVDIVAPDDTLFVVGPLANTTTYHVRVRSRNAAGFSYWLEPQTTWSTTAHAIRLTITMLTVIAAAMFHIIF